MGKHFDVFLSHNSVDKPWVENLKRSLEAKGLKVWLDKDEIRPGDLFAKALEQGMASSQAVALIISPESMKSGWVENEYYRALSLATQSELRLIPIVLRDADLPAFLRDRHWVDFRQTEKFSYGLDQLFFGITGKRPGDTTLPNDQTRKDSVEQPTSETRPSQQVTSHPPKRSTSLLPKSSVPAARGWSSWKRWAVGCSAILVMFAAVYLMRLPKSEDPLRISTEQNNTWETLNPRSDTCIIFVHGVLSDSTGCWTNTSSGAFWPRLVAEDSAFKTFVRGSTNQNGEHASVFLGGYYTAIDAGDYGLQNCAEELFAALQRKSQSVAPMSFSNLLFVCHSTGGLVVRQMLVNNTDAFASKKIGLVLAASPALGSQWGTKLEQLAKKYDNRLATELAWMSSSVKALDSQFKAAQKRLPSIVGQEWVENHFIVHFKYWPSKSYVVPYESTGRYFEPFTVPETDHFTIVKPRNLAARPHLFLKDFFLKEFLPKLDISATSDDSAASKGADTMSEARRQRLFEKFANGTSVEKAEALNSLYPGMQKATALQTLLTNSQEEVASSAAYLLEREPGAESLAILVSQLDKTNRLVLRPVIYSLGEMALIGRRKEIQPFVMMIRDALFSNDQTTNVQEVAVHALGKIGGPQALDILLEVLNSDRFSPRIQAFALNGCGRFPEIPEMANMPETKAIECVSGWSAARCKEVSDDLMFKHLSPAIVEAIQKNLSMASRSIVTEALALYSGINGVFDERKARTLLEKAADKKDPIAEIWVAYLSIKGDCSFPIETNNLVISPETIPALVENATNLQAMVALGIAREYGFGTNKNENAAFSNYRKAANLGDSQGMRLLGLFHLARSGKDRVTEGKKWLERAKQAGNELAVVDLIGLRLCDPQVSLSDFQEGRRLLEPISAKGCTTAMVPLSTILYEECMLKWNGVSRPTEDCVGLSHATLQNAALLGNYRAISLLKHFGFTEAGATGWRVFKISKGAPWPFLNTKWGLAMIFKEDLIKGNSKFYGVPGARLQIDRDGGTSEIEIGRGIDETVEICGAKYVVSFLDFVGDQGVRIELNPQ
ncbi:MAG: alpha/beta fold hydrolase [Verrucomicrobiales bacterium]|nr:alpha/beta fold hydrolase [Verrucomicrobiales bacterium]